MYSHRLDTPPPPSRFRRPWSPDPFDPAPPLHSARREPSDATVEALDLADYAMTLAARDAYDSYPPSPPSLVSDATRSSRSPLPRHRPFSLPPPSAGRSSSRRPRDSLRTPPELSEPEVDIAHFPAFSRGWYAKTKHANPLQDDFSSSPHSYDPKPSLFDPAYPANAFTADPYAYPSFSPPSYPHLASHASRSSRDVDVLPWSADPPENRPPLDPEVKEERVRMLEREFGRTAGRGMRADGGEERVVGSVDAHGKLITEGPKKRTAVRCLQILLALLAGGSSIYAALIIKPPSPAPPASKPPAFVLYVLSVLTFLVTFYFFLVYPCCCAPRARRNAASYTEGPGGMMVLPVQGLPGGKKPKKSKKSKGGGGAGDGVQVNLIVDPIMFGRDRGDDDEDEDELDAESGYASSSGRTRRQGTRRARARKRRGVFEGLAMEAQWKAARKTLKWAMVVDVGGLVLWGAEFVFVLLGKRCPSGGFQGWCDAYNLATAASCLLCVAFGFGVFFDIKDLHASGASPRTRT